MPARSSESIKPVRKIRSFMRRENRLSKRQKQAVDLLAEQLVIKSIESTPSLDLLFQRHAPTVLEIGFGMGDSLAHMAAVETQKNFIGIEVHRPGVASLLATILEHQLSNIRIFNADAVDVLQQALPDNSLDRVQIFFPDPWPKQRHHKRRLIQASFAELLAQKMKPGAVLHIATDWQNYAAQIVSTLNTNEHFTNLSSSNDYIDRPASRPFTKFEKRGKQLGHDVWDMMFRRRL